MQGFSMLIGVWVVRWGVWVSSAKGDLRKAVIVNG